MFEINSELVEFIFAFTLAEMKKEYLCSTLMWWLSQYEGEIRVLYQVTIIPTLISRKWASKELAVKAGERVDVIAKAEDDTLICRSEEGKCE